MQSQPTSPSPSEAFRVKIFPACAWQFSYSIRECFLETLFLAQPTRKDVFFTCGGGQRPSPISIANEEIVIAIDPIRVLFPRSPYWLYDIAYPL